MDYLPVVQHIRSNIRTVIIGKDDTVDLLMISLLCSGHVLIEDMPGMGKPRWRPLWRRLWAALSGGSSLRRMFCPPILPALACST